MAPKTINAYAATVVDICTSVLTKFLKVHKKQPLAVRIALLEALFDKSDLRIGATMECVAEEEGPRVVLANLAAMKMSELWRSIKHIPEARSQTLQAVVTLRLGSAILDDVTKHMDSEFSKHNLEMRGLL